MGRGSNLRQKEVNGIGKNKKVLGVIGILVILVIWNHALAEVSVVGPDGNFIGTYTTIQAGIDACPPGGTVSVSAGTYNETIYINKGIALVGIGTLTIEPPDNTDAVTFSGTHTNNALISGFRITGASGNWPYGIGIKCINQASPIITNNTISGNDYGIYCDSSSPTITNNTISGNDEGIVCDFSSPTITNNTISGNYYHGISCWYSSYPTITNNIIVSNGRYGIYCEYGNLSISYNNVWNNSWGNYYYNVSPEANDISSDPQFILSTDFHLKPTSPCIDAGTNTAPGLPTTDKNGNPRIIDGNGDGIGVVDIGAYEFSRLPLRRR